MTFAWPHLLWLLLVPAALLAWELTRARRATVSGHPKILRAEASQHGLKLATAGAPGLPGSSRSHPWLWVGLALALFALARPQWGRLEEPVFDQSREIVIAIDLSRSMLSEDIKPSRLDRAKLLTQSLLEKLTGERVGLVVFSGTAFLQSPLSADYEILREFLPALNPKFLPEGGTNYTALIDTSIGAFGSTGAADRFLIVLSDGEATDDDWRGRVDDLKKKGIRVIGLGVGTAAGSMIPDGSGGLVKDNRGAVVLSKLESGTLRELAEVTGGVYQDASNWIDLAALINATVDNGRKGQFTEKNTVRLVERYQWPLALALWCLLVSLYYEFPVRPKPRALKLQGAALPAAARGTAAAASLLLLAFLTLAFADSAQAAEDTGLELGRIYSRLANQDRLSATDLSEVAHSTLTWGQRLKENGQPVIPGPVHDAIQAVDRLIAENSKLSDWTRLRADLEALLDKPDEKKPQDKQDQQQQDQKKDQQQDDQKQQKQNSSNDDKSQQQKQQGQPKQDSSQKDQQQPSQDQKQQNADRQKQNQPHSADSAFGNMKDRKPPPPQPQDMQKVGGAPEKKDGQPPVDPAQVLQLQKLEQLRDQDSPAELFQLMDADKKGSAKKPDKDW